MDLEINDYIDFRKLFIDLYKEQEDILEEHKYEADHYKEIIDFKEQAFNEFELLEDESEFSDKEIVFDFGMCLGGANESDNRNASANFVIVYDRILDDFTSCEYEQG